MVFLLLSIIHFSRIFTEFKIKLFFFRRAFTYVCATMRKCLACGYKRDLVSEHRQLRRIPDDKREDWLRILKMKGLTTKDLYICECHFPSEGKDVAPCLNLDVKEFSQFNEMMDEDPCNSFDAKKVKIEKGLESETMAIPNDLFALTLKKFPNVWKQEAFPAQIQMDWESLAEVLSQKMAKKVTSNMAKRKLNNIKTHLKQKEKLLARNPAKRFHVALLPFRFLAKQMELKLVCRNLETTQVKAEDRYATLLEKREYLEATLDVPNDSNDSEEC
uniref:THAP-type domain-containing protein n=1 Tax=Glossina brevipalpis TaxID=37001 RepID=A0A1A9WSH2_9MUSC